MMYSWYDKNSSKDDIYSTRLRLIRKLNFDVNKTAKRYSYFMNAYYGCIFSESI